MEEIKVGEYVRTTDGIKKIVQVNEGKLSTYYGKYIVYPEYKNSKSINIKNIIKHSPNIIDLIEVGDYVNGDRIVEIEKDYYNLKLDKMVTLETPNLIIGNEEGMLSVSANEIKTILTKEQYKANCYEVK